MFKRAKVLMLPTEKAIDLNSICLNKVTGLFLCTKQHLEQSVFDNLVEYKSAVPQHLYFLSDEEIKEGDWYFSWETNYNTEPMQRWVLYNCCSKPNGTNPKMIIATTDKSLELPEPSQGFIKAFIEAYNSGNPITEVDVEYEELYLYKDGNLSKISRLGGECVPIEKLKVNPKDNTITIQRIKNSWNREELPIDIMKNLIGLLNNPVSKMRNHPDVIDQIQQLDNWIKQNL